MRLASTAHLMMIMMCACVLSKLPTRSEGGPYPCHLYSWVINHDLISQNEQIIYILPTIYNVFWSCEAIGSAKVEQTKKDGCGRFPCKQRNTNDKVRTALARIDL